MKKIIWLLYMGFPLLSWSQAALEISLTDNAKTPVSFYNLLLENEQIGYSESFTTSEQGKVLINGLSTAGTYRLMVPETAFYNKQIVSDIELISNKTTSITVTLAASSVNLETITITAAGKTTINTVNAEVASELSSKEMQALPIEGRDITRALYRLPNISQATGFYPEAPTISINGANSLFTNYLIDGLDNNENFLGGQRFQMPVGFTRNITALTNNYGAEHGLSANGIINITTKSGTNEVEGEVFYLVRPGSVLDASSDFAQRDLSGNQVKDGFQRHQVGFGVGGPIKKDKTFFYLNAEYTQDIKDNLLNVPELGLTETVRGNNNFLYLSGKIDQVWSKNWRSSLRVNIGQVGIERQGGGLEGGVTFPSAGNNQRRNSLNLALKNSYVRSGFSYEGNYQFSRFRWDYAEPTNSNSPNVTVLAPSGTVMANIGHPGFTFEDIEHTNLIQQKFTFNRKNHSLKTGIQFKSSSFELFGGGNPNGSYTVQLNQAELETLNNNNPGLNLAPQDIPTSAQVLFYGIELRPEAFAKTQNIFSVYFEDQWSVSEKLNLNIGLRYDYDNLSKGAGSQGDLNNLAPSVSANLKLSENTALRAGYGLYYDKILYAVYSDALQFNSNAADYKMQIQELINQSILPDDSNIDRMVNQGNLVASAPNITYLQGPTNETLQNNREAIFQNELRVLNPSGYDNPYAHHFMFGWQQKLKQNLVFNLDLMHNRSHDLFRLRNLNAPAPYPIDPENVVVQSPEAADRTRPVPIYSRDGQNFAVINGDTLQGVARNVVMTETSGRSNYYALNFTLQKDRGESKFAYRLMYTLSYLENNTEDINFRAMDSNDFDSEWGPSINDRRHLINTLVSYYPIENLTFTLTSLIQSGQPINRIPDASIYGTTDLNGDGRAFGDAYVGNSDRAPGESRNSDRLPWAYTFDVNLLYTFSIGKQQLEVGAQIFNVLNTENLSGYANNATQSNQIQTGRRGDAIVRRNAAPPRQFQFSLRYLF